MNGQQQPHRNHQQQQPASAVQHQYAVVKKTGSKRDIRENLERENAAVFKVRKTLSHHTPFLCNFLTSQSFCDFLSVLKILSFPLLYNFVLFILMCL
jgi:hypothetical protein